MERAFGWNRTQLSLALSFTRVEGGILGPVEGYLVDRFGTKRMVLIGMIIMGLGWLVFSRVNHLLIFYFAYLVIALGQGLGSWLALNTMMNNLNSEAVDSYSMIIRLRLKKKLVKTMAGT